MLGGLAVLLVAACGGPQPPSTPPALLSDQDLAAAEVLELVDLDVTAAGASARFELGTLAAPRRLDSLARAPLGPQQEGEAGPGRFAVVESGEVDGEDVRRIVLYEDTEEVGEGELIYEGTAEVESVAVDLAGELMLFTASFTGKGLEVFVLDLAGELGAAETLYRIDGTADDETDVSMSYDGDTWMYSTVVNEKRGAHALFLDRGAGTVGFSRVSITYTGTRIDIFDPSLSGDGDSWVVATDDELILTDIGAPIVIAGTIDDCCAVPYVGVPGVTSAIRDPSFSETADLLLMEVVASGVETIALVDPLLGGYDELVTNPGTDEVIDHPHLAGGGDALVYAYDGVVRRAEIVFDDEGATVVPTAVPASAAGLVGSAPYIARAAPPPPPPPPGTIEYSGTLVGAPTWNRPDPPEPNTVGPVGYHAFPFEAERGGLYTLTSVQDFDGFLVLYEGEFDPTQPYQGLVAVNDDGATAGTSVIAEVLEPGDYVLVTTSCGPAGSMVCGPHQGTFENTIVPPPEIGAEDPPTIQLFEVDLSVVEPAEQVEATWLVSSALPLTCAIDWGDGSEDTVPCQSDVVGTTTHAYASEGPKVVTLTASNANGEVTAKAFTTVFENDPLAFDVVVVFANDLMSPTQMAAFQDAADRWAEVIAGDLGDVPAESVPEGFSCGGMPPFRGAIDDVVISAAGEVIDGPGGTLAAAGPCLFRPAGSNGSLAPLPAYGIMRFDIADLDALEDNGGLATTILHEMGHVLGIGTLWASNDLLDYEPSGTQCRFVESFTSNPVFTGANATTEYLALGGTGNPPVEDGFGPGTKCGHWDEAAFVTELMTGFINVGLEEPLSKMTVGSLEDLGYEVDYDAADPYTLPEPALLAPSGAPYGYDEIIRVKPQFVR